MVPPTSGYGWEDAAADTIDLTASSPEPDRRPRLPAQQQRLPSYIKKEPRVDFGGSTRVKAERKAAEMYHRGSRQSVRQIHPQHMAQLIDSTNPQVLRGVLLDLCKISPALSGALARGIAPYSTFAKTLIKQHGQTLPASTSKSVKVERSNDDNAYERTKQRLAGLQKLKEPSVNRTQSPSTFAGASKPRHAGSSSVPHMKRALIPDMGDSDSDLDSFIPGEFPISVPKNDRLSLRDASTSNTPFREPALRMPKSAPRSVRPARVPENPRVKAEPETCILCHKRIEDDAEVCFYHPSSKVGSDGTTVCGSCDESLWDMGCLLGMHVSEAEAQMKQSQPGRSESPSKRLRIS